MKKLLPLLLPFFLQANAEEPNYANIKVQGAHIEILVPYKHSGAKKVGDKMPLAIGKWEYEMEMRSSRVTKEIKDPGQITCYGKDRDREIIGAVKYAAPITGDNKDKEEIIFGLITGYDRNPEDGKNIAEYEVVQRKCDIDGELKNFSGYLRLEQYGPAYAAYDTENRILYVDAIKRDGIIDSVVSCGGVDSLENAVLHMPICGEELKSKK